MGKVLEPGVTTTKKVHSLFFSPLCLEEFIIIIFKDFLYLTERAKVGAGRGVQQREREKQALY